MWLRINGEAEQTVIVPGLCVATIAELRDFMHPGAQTK